MILVYATYKIGQQTPKYVKLSPTNESKTFNNSESEREREREPGLADMIVLFGALAGQL